MPMYTSVLEMVKATCGKKFARKLKKRLKKHAKKKRKQIRKVLKRCKRGQV